MGLCPISLTNFIYWFGFIGVSYDISKFENFLFFSNFSNATVFSQNVLQLSSLGNRDYWRFSNVSCEEEIESIVVFSDLTSTMIGISDLGLGGVALGIASQGSIEFILTPFLFKFWKCSCSSDVTSIRFSRISSSDSILFLINGRNSFLILSFLNPTKIACKKRSCTRLHYIYNCPL